MKTLKRLIVAAVLLLGVSDMYGFVMIGQLDNNASSSDVNGTTVDLNLTDDLGGPKGLKTFFRWNTPMLTYSFDQSFTRYFGIKGMEAVHDAFRVLNDFFIPEDKSYVGVSQMDFARDGFLSNYNTAWVNITAQNQQIIDLKSILLGMMVNQLGVGNPHRYAFTVHNITPNSLGSEWNFNVRLKNFDPISWEPTDVINGVTYSYRLIHDAIPSAGLGVLVANPPTFTDMEEFTTDTSGNAWTAVSGIVDAFYGNTMIYWTEPPTLFNFGVYYDGMNAMGGQYQPRHALTYDDAGALKYLYRTNNFVREELEQDVTYIKPAQFLDPQAAQNFLNPNNNFMPAPGPGTAPTARTPHTFPRRSGGVQFTFPTTSPWNGARGIGGPFVGLLNAGSIAGFPGIAIRGGIDKMQFHYVPYDSLMAVNFTPTNFFWSDIVVHNNGRTVIGANNTTPGASQYMGWRDYRFATQIVGRTVLVPDIVVSAAELGTAVDGVPIAWNRTDNTAWQSNEGYPDNNSTGDANQIGPGTIRLPTTAAGKGTIQFQFGKMSEGFEMIWSGEASVVGNQETYSLWGYIKGPGANDLVTFPDNSMIWRMENEIAPKVSVPLITMLSDNGGLSAIAINSYTRTQETISIIGSGLASGTAIEIMNGDLVLQTLFPVGKYLISDQRIDIPPGVLTEMTEGTARKIRVWNTVGSSEMSSQTFNIYTGRTVVTGTSKDASVFDRAQSLTVYGYGFKSTKGRAADGGAKLSHLRIEDGQGNVLLPTDGNSTGVTWEVLSDTQAVLPMNTLTSVTDGTYRRLRVARENGSLSTLSQTNNVSLFNYITTKPTITAMKTLDVNGTEYTVSDTEALRRDRALELTGTAMNTAIALEIVQLDGSSFPNPVVINLPSAGVTVDDNGTRIQLSANVIPYNEADGHTADQFRKLKVYNAVGNYTTPTTFNVNVQPVYAGTGGFTVPNSFNRDLTLGDDVTIIGTGLLSVSEVQIVDENGSNLNSITTSITLPSPGVIVTGTSILIDISTIQFNNALNTDSIASNRYRRFRLVSKRDAVMSSQATRFDVGVPPTYASIGAITGVNYRRDTDVITFTGKGLGLLTKLEIVDLNGNPISGVSPVTENTGVTIISGTQLSLNANASALVGQGHLFDSATYLSNGIGTRRIKVTTPFGLTTSTMGDGFTVSATADFLPAGSNTSIATFAGTIDEDATNAVMDYNASNGNLIINGSNFRGIKTISLLTSGDVLVADIPVDPNALPAGITINAAGTQISMTRTVIENASAAWMNTYYISRKVRVTTAADQSTISPLINVME